MQKINKKLPGLTIAVPAYNEEANLGWVLKNTLLEAPKYLSDFEIVVIDDGSSDKTGEIADLFVKKYEVIRVIHKKNGGYGDAMLRGIKEAKKEFVAYMPADGQFLVKDMVNCFPYMKKADLILGYRGIRKDYTLYRKILSLGNIFVLWLLFGLKYKDVNWLNIWRTKEVKKIKVKSVKSRGVFLLAEIIINFRRKNLKIVEAPSFYRVRRGGKVKNAKPSVAFRTLIDALSFWLSLKFNKF